MSETNLERAKRIATRALAIVNDANAHPAIVGLKTRVTNVVQQFLGADEQVRVAAASANKETDESIKSAKPLAREFDVVRTAIMANASHEQIAAASSQLATGDDLLKAAEEAEAILERHKDEAWASSLLPGFAPLVDAASKEWTEARDAKNVLQKAQAVRQDAVQLFDTAMVDLRRVVRAVMGSTSKAYQSIKAHRRGADNDPEPTPPPR